MRVLSKLREVLTMWLLCTVITSLPWVLLARFALGTSWRDSLWCAYALGFAWLIYPLGELWLWCEFRYF